MTGDWAALRWTRADGTRPPQLLLECDNPVRQIMLSPDGETLAFTEQDPETKSDLWIVPLDLTDPDAPVVGTPEPLIKTDINEGVPAFSPDGKWIAYISDVLGPYDVWVQPFPGLGGRWQITSGGGRYPFWSATEDALLFQFFPGMMRVEYTIEGERFVPGAPRLSTPVSVVPMPIGFEGVDLAPDGRLVALSNVTAGTSEPDRVTFLLNAFNELRRRAAARR